MVAGASGYDIVLPSDYMVKRMIERGMLQKLDKVALPSLGNIAPEFFKAPFDPGLEYSVPFTSGNTGLLINTAAVPVTEDEVSWTMMFDSPDPDHTSMLDDMREVFAAMLFLNGFDPNERRLSVLSRTSSAITAAKKTSHFFRQSQQHW